MAVQGTIRPIVAGDAMPRANPLFDAEWYLSRHADVAASGIDPWRHYVAFGAYEGRKPNPLFDSAWYLLRYPEVRIARANPLVHYWEYGAARGCDPNSLFDGRWYLQRNPDARAVGGNPLLHYLRQGAATGRDPSVHFDSAWYLRANPDLRPGRMTPLGDYLLYGRIEGRSAVHRPPRRLHTTRRRIAVYTAIVGDYDCLKIPTVVDTGCDYYCFTDRDISWQRVWQRRDIDWRDDDPTRMARFVKLHPQRYLRDHDVSIWVDGNLRLNCTPHALLPAGDDWDIGVWRHPYRDCLYAEAAQCIIDDKDDAGIICAQMQRYRDAGFPAHAGLAENCVLARRHHTPDIVALDEAWWGELSRGSRRDQLSLDFLLHGRRLRTGYLGPPGSNVRTDPRLHFFAHNQPRPAW